MKNQTIKKLIIASIAVLICIAAAVCVIFQVRYSQKPKFHDLTVELGTEIVNLSDFATEYARPEKLRFVSDPELVDLNRVGSTRLTLAHGRQQETVTLTVEDTTAPEVTFRKKLSVRIDQTPTAEDFITHIADESETKVYFASDVVVPKDYAELNVTVVVEDACGNRTEGRCTLTHAWMVESYDLEYGRKLTPEDILLDPDRDAALLDQASLEQVNTGKPGEYLVTGQSGGKTAVCRVTVADTMGPDLVLKDVRVYVGGTVNKNAFISSASDPSGVASVRVLSTLDTSAKGKKTIIVEARDRLGHMSLGETTLWISTDFNGPVITGIHAPLTVEKHGTPDFGSGVSAYDGIDGACPVTWDASNLDVHTAGIYYVPYSAMDNSGNVTTKKRRVEVEHDAGDTAALVVKISDQLEYDPEKIRDYVRSYIRYNHDWGGEDPVWTGFVNRGGNCYVHAMCLKSIFDHKGIESQLIWVTNKSHYWLIVKIDGQWKHIDPTPGNLHSRYSLMNDRQRLSTLSGRVWDTTAWPACE